MITRTDHPTTQPPNQPGTGTVRRWLDRWASPCGERNGKKKNSTDNRGSRQQATCIDERRGREEALCWINAAVRSGGGKKISTPLTFFPSDTKSSHGMDPLVPSQRIAQNDSTWARDSPGRNFIENGTVDKKIRGFSHIGGIKDSMNWMSQWNSKLFCTGNYRILWYPPAGNKKIGTAPYRNRSLDLQRYDVEKKWKNIAVTGGATGWVPTRGKQ